MPPLVPRRPAASPPKKDNTPFMQLSQQLVEYQDWLRIDKNGLDEEWVRHPELVLTVGTKHAFAQSYRDEAESILLEVLAKADGHVRAVSAKDKPTEAEIRSLVAIEPDVKAAQKTCREWKLLTSRWGILVKSFDSRQYALRALSDMDARGYWVRNSHKPPAAVGDRVANSVRSTPGHATVLRRS